MIDDGFRFKKQHLHQTDQYEYVPFNHIEIQYVKSCYEVGAPLVINGVIIP